MQQGSETPEEVFGRRVASYMEDRGWSQRKFAEQLSANNMPVDASAVSRMLKGNRAMRLSEVYTVAETLGVSVQTLLPNLTNKRDKLNHLRQHQHRLWGAMAESMVKLVETAEDVVEILNEDPSLMDAAYKGIDVPRESTEHYLEWVASRAEESVIDMIKTDQIEPFVDFLWVESEESKAKVLQLVSELLSPFITVGSLSEALPGIHSSPNDDEF